jgi:propionyl-CoA carboxylase alpha chain
MSMTTPIRRILVANRGEIACRIMRTARDLGISTVAVHSDVDSDAPFVRRADRAVHLPGVTSADTYLDGERVIDAARRSGADAIHPGYGFLSENPGFARAVQSAGLTWIGPTPESIEAMALKVEAKRIAATAGVPLVPGAELPQGLSDEEALSLAESVGYPLLVKASAGGGGKGMRVVTDRGELITSLASARREARSAFGDDTVFVERYLAGARHVEVQVFGDVHGAVVHLMERECSIQRRHQKVIEEAPSPGVTAEVRARLHESAVALARTIGYVGAGTVEFMVFGAGQAQECFFLEMNTRLQVEHPVTELITGIDLVAWQIAVAQGQPLPLDQAGIVASGHAIEARLYAEDPAHDYLPATGVIHRFAAADRTGLRIDSGVADGTVITPFYDPMLAKVIGHGATRSIAAAVLADGLSRTTIHGPINNRDSLVAILRSEAFLAGDTTTSFLDENPEVSRPDLPTVDRDRHVVAAATALAHLDAPDENVPLGWRNVPGVPEFVSLRSRADGVVATVLQDAGGAVRIATTDAAPFGRVFDLDATTIPDVVVHVRYTSKDGGADLVHVDTEVAGVRAACVISRYGNEVFVDDGLFSSTWTIEPRFVDHSTDAVGHGPATKVPGTITAVQVVAGDTVTEGQVLVILEAMKMEHSIRADVDGVVERVLVEVGQSVEAHTVVVEFREDTEATDD